MITRRRLFAVLSSTALAGSLKPAVPPPSVVHVVHVHAMDAKSLLYHSAEICAAVRKGIQMGHPLASELQQKLSPQIEDREDREVEELLASLDIGSDELYKRTQERIAREYLSVQAP